MYETQLINLGLKNTDAFTCTCYLPEVGNIPEKGQLLGWSESSAVSFANSVIGARTNRNSGGIDFLMNILGKAPYHDLLTDEGRKARWLIKVQTSEKPNAQLFRERNRNKNNGRCAFYRRPFHILRNRTHRRS